MNELQFDKQRRRVKLCPCGKSNKDGKFVPYKEHELYGYCHSCGDTFFPPLDNSNKPEKSANRQYNKPETVKAKFGNRIEVDATKPILTEVKTYDSSESGIIQCHSLTSTVERLNTFKRAGGKDSNPAMLKGIYKGGTSGTNCFEASALLPFDIDVKPTENESLLIKANNKLVVAALREIAVMVWHSNSGNGIAGFVWVSDLKNEKDPQRHLKRAKAVYDLITKYVEAKTGIKVVFDWQQGKFRQIRYLAEQKDLVRINCTPIDIATFVDPNAKEFIKVEVFKSTLNSDNNFIDYLHTLFDAETVQGLQAKYFIGSHHARWNRSTVFWQIDVKGNVRTGIILPYDPITGKRVKDPDELADWMHNHTNEPKINYCKCLFGEHLLQGNSKPVAIVESEKTAIIMSVLYPQFVWLACGGKDGLKPEKMKVLIGRTVTLFPDNGGFDLWNELIKSMPRGIRFTKVSDLLESKATADGKGIDLADCLIITKKPNKSHDTQLFDIAAKVLPPEANRTKQAIIDSISNLTKVATERAVKGFDLMLKSGAILPTLNPELFYLKGSTPF